MSEPIRILIADDHAHFKAGVRALLLTEADLHVVGDAPTGDAAVTLSEEQQPNVVLMDLNMPGLNGVEATRRIVSASLHIAVLVLTMFEDDDSVFAALQAGARGYVLKGAPKADLLRCIRAVAGGDAVFGAAIARRLARYFSALRNAPRAGLA